MPPCNKGPPVSEGAFAFSGRSPGCPDMPPRVPARNEAKRAPRLTWPCRSCTGKGVVSDERVLEIRTYRIRDGQRDEFARCVSAVQPLLQRHGIDVLGHGPSIEDDEHYVLLRSFASLAEREQQEGAFYEGDEWLAGPRAGILELIETYHTVVLRSTPEAVRTLAESLAG